MSEAMRGTYGGKAARFHMNSDRKSMSVYLEKDPGVGSMSFHNIWFGMGDITVATAEQFRVIADRLRLESQYLTPTADGSNVASAIARADHYASLAGVSV